VRLGKDWAHVRLKGRLSGMALVGASHESPDALLELRVAKMRIGGVPIPGVFTSWVTRHFDPTVRLRNLPVPVFIAPIHIRAGRVDVGAS
jgi:hypothetical protein